MEHRVHLETPGQLVQLDLRVSWVRRGHKELLAQ